MSKDKTQSISKPKEKPVENSKGMFATVNQFLDKHSLKIFFALLAITCVYGYWLFDYRISMLGDDSAYLMRASDFVHKGIFPSFQGPMFPIAVSFIIRFFGFKLVYFKMLSFFSLLGSVALFYVGLRKRIPASILFATLFVYVLNSTLHYYGSQTFSEAFYLLMQSFVIFVFCHFLIEKETISIKEDTWKFLLLGLSLILLVQTRSVGYSAIMSISVFYVLKKNFIGLGMVLVSFALFFGLFAGYKSMYKEEKTASQLKVLLQKDAYDATKGNEDIGGFVTRFIDNSEVYLSKEFPGIMNWKNPTEEEMQQPPMQQTSGLLTLFIYIVFFAAVFYAFKDSKTILFLAMYAAFFLGIVFVILQTSWDQDRLIITAVPLMILILFYVIYYLLEHKAPKALQIGFYVIAAIIIMLNFTKTSTKVSEFSEIQEKNKEGDLLYGYPSNWHNYLEMCQWVDQNLPKTGTRVVCRKPEMAFVYSNGREFDGFYRSPEQNQTADSVLQLMKNRKITHVLQDQIFGTIGNYLNIINRQYPEKLKVIHTIGDPNDGAASLIEIKY